MSYDARDALAAGVRGSRDAPARPPRSPRARRSASRVRPASQVARSTRLTGSSRIAASTSSSENGGEPGGDRRLLTQEGELFLGLDDLEVTPELLHRRLDSALLVRQCENAHHLREVRVRCGSDQQSAGQAAGLGGVHAEPRACPGACPESVRLRNGGFVERARLSTFAPHDEVDQVAARPPFVQPELSQTLLTRLVVVTTSRMNKATPVQVVDVASRTGTHEARRDDRELLELATIQSLPLNEPPRALTILRRRLLLDDEPLWKAKGANPSLRLRASPWSGRAVGLGLQAAPCPMSALREPG